MRAATSALPFVLFVSIVACNAITGVGDLTRVDTASAPNEAGAPCNGADLTRDSSNCGECGNACGSGDFCAASACVSGCTGGLLYVSPTGSDGATGCTTEAPLLTVSHALSVAKAQGNALVQEIHVCKGSYKEPQISLDFKSSLRGGYDCATWKRTAGFGYPLFDKTNLTEIFSTVTGANAITTLVVGGAAVDASVVVDGFTIHGSAGATTTAALGLTGGNPVIEDDQLLGGAPVESAAPVASIGIRISGGASPEIKSCSVDGGSGKSTSTSESATGSIGIAISSDSGSPNVHDATISGGSGTAPSGNGSIGIAVNGGTFTSANAIRLSAINGGTGKVSVKGGASVAIASISPNGVEIDGNVIHGGSGTCVGANPNACNDSGISAGIGSLVARGNKIYGGDATGLVGGGSVGITVSGLKSFIAENNMIHGGNKDAAATHGTARAIEISGVAAPQLRSNTLYSGNAGSGSSSVVVIDPQVSALVMDDNLFAMPAGSGTVPSYGITLACSANLVASVRNNVMLDPPNVMIYSGNGGGTGTCMDTTVQKPSTMSGAEMFLAGTSATANVTGNVRLSSSCGAETSSCVPNAGCAGAGACVITILSGWSIADSGFTVLQSDGWKITPLCAVSQGGLDVSATLKTDFYGSARTAPVSVGADENDAACTN